MKKFRFTYTVEHILEVDSVWPDGDAPENPTPKDVLKVFMDDCNFDIASGLENWNIGPDYHDIWIEEVND